MSDPSLLSAELDPEDEEDEDEALRRLLLQAPPEPGPARRVTPQPGLCVKTRAGGHKVFVNVCHSPEVPPPPPGLLGEPPEPPEPGARIPMSLGEPHAELDRGGRGCTAYDVVVNSGFFRTLQADPLYLEFFLTVALEGLSEKYGVELELTGWRVLRNRKFLGSLSAQNIRARPQKPRIQELPGTPPQNTGPPQREQGSPSPPEPPRFVVVAEPSAREPRVLQARVHLPQLEGAESLWLGLSEERLLLARTPPEGAAAGPPGRQGALLELGLPLPPDAARCRARFHRRSKVLTVTMPLRA